MKLTLKLFKALFLTVAFYQTTVFSAQPSAGKGDQKEEKTVTSLSLIDLISEIKFVGSRCLSIEEIKAANAAMEAQYAEGYGSEEYRKRFVSYRDSRIKRKKDLKEESKRIIVTLESSIPKNVSDMWLLLMDLNHDAYSAYKREFDAYNRILLCVLVYLRIQLINKERSDEALSFMSRRLLPYVRVCFNQLGASLKEFDVIEGTVANRLQEAELAHDREVEWQVRELGDAISVLLSSGGRDQSFDKEQYKEFSKENHRKKPEELSKEMEEDQKPLEELKLLWRRVIKTLEELVNSKKAGSEG